MPKSAELQRVKPKKKCCKDGPRCKRCPVVLKRLEDRGLATRSGKWVVLSLDVTKADWKAARARGGKR
jgi:hypothetical protein